MALVDDWVGGTIPFSTRVCCGCGSFGFRYCGKAFVGTVDVIIGDGRSVEWNTVGGERKITAVDLAVLLLLLLLLLL